MKSSTLIGTLAIGALLGAAAAYFVNEYLSPPLAPRFVVLRPPSPPLDTSVRWYDHDDVAYVGNGHSIFDEDKANETDWCRLPADLLDPKFMIELDGQTKRTINSDEYAIRLDISKENPEIFAEIRFKSSSAYVDWKFTKVEQDKGTQHCVPTSGAPNSPEGMPDELMNLSSDQISFLGGNWTTIRLIE